jgi:catechol 2,3-dioxygenase-like lactoylglutathione lyase family enzyme
MTTDLKIDSIYQVLINVKDLDGAMDFYGGKLGMKFVGKFPPGLAFYNLGGVQLMVSAIPGESSGPNNPIYFKVPDIQAAFETMKSRGVEFTHEPHVLHSTDNYELWMAFFNDPEGNLMAIADERGELGA